MIENADRVPLLLVLLPVLGFRLVLSMLSFVSDSSHWNALVQSVVPLVNLDKIAVQRRVIH